MKMAFLNLFAAVGLFSVFYIPPVVTVWAMWSHGELEGIDDLTQAVAFGLSHAFLFWIAVFISFNLEVPDDS